MKMVLRQYGKQHQGQVNGEKITRSLWQTRQSHLVRHPQASPFAWQSSPLRSGCRTRSQPGLTCACKVQKLSKAPSAPKGMDVNTFNSRGPVKQLFPSLAPSCPQRSLLDHGLFSSLDPWAKASKRWTGHPPLQKRPATHADAPLNKK